MRFLAAVGFCALLFGGLALVFSVQPPIYQSDVREKAERVEELTARNTEIVGQFRVEQFQEKNHCVLLDDCVQKTMAAGK